MHATLSAPLPAPRTVVSFPQAQQRAALLPEVTAGTARAVALYASDMPSTYRARPEDAARIEAWIVQGIERLGLDETRRRGRFLRSFNLLMLKGEDGPAVRAAYRKYFPQARRIDRAESVAATLALLSLQSTGATREGRQAA
ncbi:hypothetical protein ACFZDG_10890 [Kitasatospora xanthocidica]|uniref:hypothetical protein n=1 Tax=Kitasatospora xanthocidica TaxID=83382 RepID=UPI0036E163A3